MCQKCLQDYWIINKWSNEHLNDHFVSDAFCEAFFSPRQIPVRPNRRLSLLPIANKQICLSLGIQRHFRLGEDRAVAQKETTAAGCRPLEKVGQREFTMYTCPPSILSHFCFLFLSLSLSLSLLIEQFHRCFLVLYRSPFPVYPRPFSSSVFIITFLRISVLLFIFLFESRHV